jgi:hypothetical protein
MSVEPEVASRRRAPTRGDVILLLLLAAAIPWTRSFLLPAGAPQQLVVLSADAPPRAFTISESRDVEISGPLGTTRLRIRDSSAWIVESPCERRLCQTMGRLRPGRSLVCIPNRVVVRASGVAGDVDAVTR